jgi:phosphoglycolate phosphatase-like HAD superfamily hydrolase
LTRVLLFDIDQTLLYTVGAGSLAMKLAFDQMFGIENGFANIEFSGRTDLFILAEALRQHGIDGGPAAQLDEFLRGYYAILPETLRQREGYLMPGFPQLLEALSEKPNVRLGLATGNFSEAAHIKLDYYGIDRFFAGGGFGEESLERGEVVRVAVERTAERVPPDDILVIGDTPHDISSALENRVVAVGVATGNYTVEQLRESGAQLVFEDFSDWQGAAAILTGENPVQVGR